MPKFTHREIYQMDQKANQFAMALLMPAELVKHELERMGGIDIDDDKSVAALAKKFRVSNNIMAIRLGQILKVCG